MYSIRLSSARRFNLLLGLGCVSVEPRSHRNTAGFRQMPQGQRRAFRVLKKETIHAARRPEGHLPMEWST